MPQMKPMNWFYLFIFNLMVFFSLVVINYFNLINKNINKHKNQKTDKSHQTNLW